MGGGVRALRSTDTMPGVGDFGELGERCGDIPVKAAVVADDGGVVLFELGSP